MPYRVIMAETNPFLSSFLIGKFQRASICEALEGLTIADISGVEMTDFLACLNQKDHLIGTRLWADVLLPVRNAWQDWKGLEAGFVTVQKRLTDRIIAARAHLTTLNNPAVGGLN
jgi:hypothetical protein